MNGWQCRLKHDGFIIRTFYVDGPPPHTVDIPMMRRLHVTDFMEEQFPPDAPTWSRQRFHVVRRDPQSRIAEYEREPIR